VGAQELLPVLSKKSVIVMDNASFHKRSDCINAIKKQKHEILFLPPYSPDLNPIEKKWAQAKSIRKKFRCDPYQLFQIYKL
jgi:transposase